MKDKRAFLMAIVNILLVVGLFYLGWFVNDAYRDFKNKRDFDGLFLRKRNYSEMGRLTTKADKLGDWVCVNVKGMDFKRAYEVCQHEVGHEIFAEYCEDHLEECINLTEQIE